MISIQQDLRGLLGPARDQGERESCMACAASDTHASLRKQLTALSVEYFYYHALKRRGGNTHGGFPLSIAFETLEKDGQPAESAWPYSLTHPVPTEWKPPTVADLYRALGAGRSPSLPTVRAALDLGTPLLLVMHLSDAFDFPQGDCVIDVEEPVDIRVHAVVAIGYGESGGAKLTLIRNSWGADWGLAGHAWLSDKYLSPRLLAFATLTTVP